MRLASGIRPTTSAGSARWCSDVEELADAVELVVVERAHAAHRKPSGARRQHQQQQARENFRNRQPDERDERQRAIDPRVLPHRGQHAERNRQPPGDERRGAGEQQRVGEAFAAAPRTPAGGARTTGRSRNAGGRSGGRSPYWTYHGLSRPNRTRIASIVSAEMPGFSAI